MTILNIFNKSFIILFISLTFTIEASYYTREININNAAEVTEIAKNLFLKSPKIRDEQTGIQRDPTPEEYQELLNQAKNKVLGEIKSNYNIFVCTSNKNKQINGILYCKYGHRKQNTAEYMQSIVYNENSIKNYFFNDFTTIMLSMIQYAEKFYKSISINNIVVHVLSKNNASFYSQHGYVLLNAKQANDLYYTTTEKCVFIMGLPLLIACWPVYMVYKMLDWGIYYKKL